MSWHKRSVDWVSQWALHAPGFKEGLLEISVADKAFKMKAGPGFGNLSHPTTALMIELMPPYIPHKTVLDIGTGSGILALAAHALQASRVFAIDIDPLAIDHARENASLNGFEIDFRLGPERLDVILLNMIWEEQKVALKEAPPFHGVLICSGILKEQEEGYHAFVKAKGWQLLETKEKEGWLAFAFLTV